MKLITPAQLASKFKITDTQIAAISTWLEENSKLPRTPIILVPATKFPYPRLLETKELTKLFEDAGWTLRYIGTGDSLHLQIKPIETK